MRYGGTARQQKSAKCVALAMSVRMHKCALPLYTLPARVSASSVQKGGGLKLPELLQCIYQNTGLCSQIVLPDNYRIRYHAVLHQGSVIDACRDGAMRTELESRLVFAAPSELLVASPLSAASQRLLGAYTSQTAGLRSQTAPRNKYSAAGAQAALSAFYAHAGQS